MPSPPKRAGARRATTSKTGTGTDAKSVAASAPASARPKSAPATAARRSSEQRAVAEQAAGEPTPQQLTEVTEPGVQDAGVDTHKELALDSLERARRLMREASREERLQFLIARAQVHALLALEESIGAGQASPVDDIPTSKRPPSNARLAVAAAKDSVSRSQPEKARRARRPRGAHVFEFDNEDEVPERIRQFVELTNDRMVGAAFDLESSSSTLLVAFGGMPGHMGMPPFEFFNISQDLEVKKAYLRDLDHAWYHAGIRGFADTPAGVVDKLRDVIGQADANKVVFAGNSAGGWAALLFGALVDVDLVLAFSPQTTLVEEELQKVNDTRWDRWLRQARRQNQLLEDLLDLRPVLKENPPGAGGLRFVHYASAFDLDAFHAERLKGLPGLELDGHPEQKGRHGLIRDLRDSGALGEILADAVAERPVAR